MNNNDNSFPYNLIKHKLIKNKLIVNKLIENNLIDKIFVDSSHDQFYCRRSIGGKYNRKLKNGKFD